MYMTDAVYGMHKPHGVIPLSPMPGLELVDTMDKAATGLVLAARDAARWKGMRQTFYAAVNSRDGTVENVTKLCAGVAVRDGSVVKVHAAVLVEACDVQSDAAVLIEAVGQRFSQVRPGIGYIQIETELTVNRIKQMMCNAMMPVLQLHRVSVGGVSLGAFGLQQSPGAWAKLIGDEPRLICPVLPRCEGSTCASESASEVAPQLEQSRDADAPSVKLPENVYAVYKPYGMVTTMSPEECQGGGEMRLLFQSIAGEGEILAPVGRLDKATTGLLLAASSSGPKGKTDAGIVSEQLLRPGRCRKTYLAAIDAGRFSEEAIRTLCSGVSIVDHKGNEVWVDKIVAAEVAAEEIPVAFLEEVQSRFHELQFRGIAFVRVEICVGINHVVKKLMDKVGMPVLQLHRSRIGPISLETLGLHSPRDWVKLGGDQIRLLLSTGEESAQGTLVEPLRSPHSASALEASMCPPLNVSSSDGFADPPPVGIASSSKPRAEAPSTTRPLKRLRDPLEKDAEDPSTTRRRLSISAQRQTQARQLLALLKRD